MPYIATALAQQFDLWVPRTDIATVAPRSAIVSDQTQVGDSRLCYIEGNLFEADNLGRYAERVWCAASRAVQRYPTVAKLRVAVEDLQHVGVFDARSRRITALTDSAALSVYLGAEPLPMLLTATEARRRVETALRTLLAQPGRGAVWERLHAWTGSVRRGAGGVELECVTLDGAGTEWLSGLALPNTNLAHGLRHLLDEESAGWN